MIQAYNGARSCVAAMLKAKELEELEARLAELVYGAPASIMGSELAHPMDSGPSLCPTPTPYALTSLARARVRALSTVETEETLFIGAAFA